MLMILTLHSYHPVLLDTDVEMILRDLFMALPYFTVVILAIRYSVHNFWRLKSFERLRVTAAKPTFPRTRKRDLGMI